MKRLLMSAIYDVLHNIVQCVELLFFVYFSKNTMIDKYTRSSTNTCDCLLLLLLLPLLNNTNCTLIFCILINL